jgi:DNA mismatch repair protein MutS2
VIPVKVEARRGVAGIIHGASSTGATVFVEPLELVETNNELVTLREEEEAEGRRILLEMGARLRATLPELRSLSHVLGEADMVGACAIFAEQFGCGPAAEAKGITLEEARHPVLEAALQRRGGEIVPLDLEIPSEGRVLVLSGPNTGGKTVSMKTIGLLSLMSQCGILIPAKHAALPIFARILADVGDRQSIQENLSTFSARMLRVAEMSKTLKGPALVLLDEVGGGTDPEEEGALAVAIVDHFRRRGASVIATTHHGALKAYAEVTEGVSNASMEFDEEALAPTFRLIPGTAGRSGGLEMAERFGLPGEILEVARGRLSDAHRMADEYLGRLQSLVEERKRDAARARRERERAAVERGEALERAREEERDLRRRYEEAIAGAMEKIGQAATEIEKGLKDRAAALQLRSEARRAARRAREAVAGEVAPPDPRHLSGRDLDADSGGSPSSEAGLAPGARVQVHGLGAQGMVQKVNRKRGRVDLLVRGKRMTVSLADCELLEEPARSRPRILGPLPAGVSLETGRSEEVPSEINLIGRTVEEARSMMEKFLDNVILTGHREVRIVHGHGTGRLRKAVAAFLGEHPMVAEHRPADPRFGGTGATVVILKD